MRTARAHAATVELDGRLFVFGGQSTAHLPAAASQLLTSSEAFDGSAWHDAPELPARLRLPSAVAHGGRAYLLGLTADGSGGGGAAALYVFDGAAWSAADLRPTADVPLPLLAPGAVLGAWDGDAYVVGGDGKQTGRLGGLWGSVLPLTPGQTLPDSVAFAGVASLQ